MQRLVDNLLAVTKESVKTLTYESLNNVVRLINGVSAMLLSVLPGKASILEGIHGWELRPTFRGPRLPRWMENGVSSFNHFIHELSVDSDSSMSIDYSSDGEDSVIYPGSPSSQSSLISRESDFIKLQRTWACWTGCILWWILFPVKFFFSIPRHVFGSTFEKGSKTPDRTRNKQFSVAQSPRRLQSLKDHFVKRATDRRRGIVEDLHLAIEVFIESTFDVVHKAAHCLLAPVDTARSIYGWFFTESSGDAYSTSKVCVTTSVLADDNPSLAERKTGFRNSLNTDARTCKDVITELGYPYEAIRVVTSDGYVLLLERIPRRDSQKVVYLQHGILDSSMGWVSNGVVGSPAFAAFDQGYDVFLGNFRGLVSREHVDKNISSRQYWNYSINEHGVEDIPAMIDKIHDIKTSELSSDEAGPDGPDSSQPYKLCAICHSLGGAAALMYVVTRRMAGQPHRLSRLILLSPAGFHGDSGAVFAVAERLFLLTAPLLGRLVPAFYVPTRFFRMVLHKLARDLHELPAVGGLVQTLVGYAVGGDSSNWVGALGLPHYNMDDMPGVAFGVALHLAQMRRTGRFAMFDHGGAAANAAAYGGSRWTLGGATGGWTWQWIWWRGGGTGW